MCHTLNDWTHKIDSILLIDLHGCLPVPKRDPDRVLPSLGFECFACIL
jgi:hypothetical protein